jgi:cysteinyl-tRNA synthetase
VQDSLRLLRRTSYDVLFVENVTDIDDKIILRAHTTRAAEVAAAVRPLFESRAVSPHSVQARAALQRLAGSPAAAPCEAALAALQQLLDCGSKDLQLLSQSAASVSAAVVAALGAEGCTGDAGAATAVWDVQSGYLALARRFEREFVEDMLKPIGLGMSAKPNSAKAKDTEQFYGRLNEAMQAYHDQNGKWPQTQDVRKMAGSLLTPGAQSGGMLWDSSARAYQGDDPSKFYVPLPSRGSSEYSGLATSFEKVMGHKATDAELQQWYTRYKMSGGK